MSPVDPSPLRTPLPPPCPERARPRDEPLWRGSAPGLAQRAIAVVALALLLASGAQAQTPVTGFVQVDTGGDGVYGEHTCAVNAAGGVQCWGSNRSGQLGDGSTTSRETPGNVAGLASGISAVSASGNHSCALTGAGEVRCWGANDAGQLGDGSTTQRLTPVSVSGLGITVRAIDSGDTHTCALTTGDGVKCWGGNASGQLGNNSNVASAAPVDVDQLTSGVASLAVGHLHSCVVTSAGGVKCWGDNSRGQLGNNSTTSSPVPVDVTGLGAGSGVVAVSAASGHTCALTGGGAVKCWGLNSFGQLGIAPGANSLVPVDVPGLASGVTAIATGIFNGCALGTGGDVRCWGANFRGGLGNGGAGDSQPVGDPVVGLASGATAVTAGASNACALTTGGGIKCWGYNTEGQLGNNLRGLFIPPTDALGLSSGVVGLSAGVLSTCVVTSAGAARCWGFNARGRLGDGTTVPFRLSAVGVVGLDSGVSAITTGGNGGGHSCVLTTAGGIQCWGGSNGRGELGDNSTTPRAIPGDVFGLTSGMRSVNAGERHTCALTLDGAAKCWGGNSQGQLGNGTTTNALQPVDVVGLASGVTAIAPGAIHTCAVTAGGAAQCWGLNLFGELGDGTQVPRTTPVGVSGLGSGVVAVDTGAYTSCALTDAGAVLCWGINDVGQLGDGTTTNRLTPTPVVGLGSNVTAITVGGGHACALTGSGGVKCWGYNEEGQLGDGSNSNRLTPVDVAGLTSGVVAISAGTDSLTTCALTNAGGVKCWGRGNEGQVGDGVTIGVQVTAADVVMLTVPGAPTAATATAGNTTASVSFVAPANNGGRPITGYTVTGNPGGLQSSGCTASPCTVTGLSNGVAYTFTVTATNLLGEGPASAPTASVIPATVPGAPTAATATAGNTTATVSFTAPASNGGLPITAYTVTSNPGGLQSSGCTASPCTVTGLSNGVAYTFTVTATNAVGVGPASAPSTSVVPQAPQTITFNPPPAVQVGGSGMLSASGGGSGNPVVFSTLTPALCTVSGSNGSTLNGVAEGSCLVAANQAGNAAFSAAAQQTQTVTISARPVFTVGGSLAGYVGSGLVLRLSPATDLAVAAGATQFVFPAMADGSNYAVSVATQPGEPTQLCSVDNGTGTLAGANVSSVVVSCQTTATVPGAPAAVQLDFSGGTATVSWTPPASDGGWSITGYRVVLQPGDLGCEVSGTPAPTRCQFTGVQPGVTYTAAVSARNGIGLGLAASGSGTAAAAPPAVIPLDQPWALAALALLLGLAARPRLPSQRR